MKVVKFIGDDPAHKQFAEVLRKRVNEYFKQKNMAPQGNLHMYFKAFVMLALYLTPFVVLLTVPVTALSALGLVVLMGIGEAGIGMAVMHDAAHGSFSRKLWVNKAFASTMFLLGSNTFNWKIQHNLLHHTFTNIYGYDQDIATKAVIRLCEHAPRKRFHRFQHLYAFPLYGLMTFSKLFTDIGQLRTFNREGITREQKHDPRKEMFKLVLTKVLYMGIILGLPFWLSGYSWWQILLGFMLLHVTAGMIMSTVFQMAHVVEGAEQPLPDANGVIHNGWAVHQLRTTSDFARNNILLSWYVGGLNFQIEHHLFPNICHVHYSKIAPIVEETAHEFGLTYNLKRSFGTAFASHYRRLKALGHATVRAGEPIGRSVHV